MLIGVIKIKCLLICLYQILTIVTRKGQKVGYAMIEQNFARADARDGAGLLNNSQGFLIGALPKDCYTHGTKYWITGGEE